VLRDEHGIDEVATGTTVDEEGGGMTMDGSSDAEEMTRGRYSKQMVGLKRKRRRNRGDRNSNQRRRRGRVRKSRKRCRRGRRGEPNQRGYARWRWRSSDWA
jgi:hypothetical protein